MANRVTHALIEARVFALRADVVERQIAASSRDTTKSSSAPDQLRRIRTIVHDSQDVSDGPDHDTVQRPRIAAADQAQPLEAPPRIQSLRG